VLLVWEVSRDGRRPPILALVGIVIPWLSLKGLSEHGASPDTQAALFLSWTLLISTVLGLAIYAPNVYDRLLAGHHLGFFRSHTSLARTTR
ncbi:MAG: hypothetical protein ACRDK2_00380, partial [Solirubrobacteraceae bacterium]